MVKGVKIVWFRVHEDRGPLNLRLLQIDLVKRVPIMCRKNPK